MSEPRPLHHPLTIREAWQLGREHLLALRIDAAGLEAEVLLRHVLGLSRTGLYLAWEREVGPEKWDQFRSLLQERSTGRPVAFIVGHREFMGLDLIVDERVLIPRPETEVLVEFLLHVLRDLPAPRIADVGTGSGAIAVALAHYLPTAHILATDVSGAALEVAAMNARRHNVAARVTFAEGDLLAPVREQGWMDLDAVASNPPYVAPEAVRQLSREIREFEPEIAVVDPAGGTAFHQRLIEGATGILRKAGWLVVEVGAGQAPEVVELFQRTGAYAEIRTIPDLLGIERTVAGRFQM